MQNAPQIDDSKTEPRNPAPAKKGDGVGAWLFVSTLALAAGGTSVMFNQAVTKMQDNDPQFVLPVAQQRIEDMGYSNVRFKTFNKVAGKPAEITFTAEKAVEGAGFMTYEGEANCTSMSCPKITVAISGVKR